MKWTSRVLLLGIMYLIQHNDFLEIKSSTVDLSVFKKSFVYECDNVFKF